MKFYILKKSKYLSGFTLIELLIAMLIGSLVVTLAGSALAKIMQASENSRTETTSRVNANRALDFISDDVRMASTISGSTALSWAWTGTNLGSTGSPSAQLHLQIPISQAVTSMTAIDDLITISNHGFSNGNAVMFTGSGAIAGGLSLNTPYYIIEATTNTFKLANTTTNLQSGTAVDLTSNSSGTLSANQLVIYYIRDNTSTWLGAKTINRSLGPCVGSYASSNCPVLVDSIASSGFTTTVTNSKQVTLNVTSQLSDSPVKTATPLTTTVATRNN